MKIGIYALWNVNWDGRVLRVLGCHAAYLRQFLSLTDGVRLFTSCRGNRNGMNTETIADPRLEVVRLPAGSFASVWVRQRAVRRIFAENLTGLDAVYARVFDPCPWLLAPLCESRQIGLVFHLVGDAVQGILQRRDWSPMRRYLTRIVFLAEERKVFQAAKRHALLINGGELTRIYGPRHPSPKTVISSTLEDSHLYTREDTCGGGAIVVLYAGMIRPAKRLETLIDAADLLVRNGLPVRLRIVGEGDPPSYLHSLRDHAQSKGLLKVVEFRGFIPHGDALNRQYRGADIYAFPSLTEGSPRTLLEAASQSLPIVTTDVGSVRDLFTDGQSALIVPADDPPAMAQAIRRLIEDPETRRRCIRNAYATAKTHTCQDFIQTIVNCLGERRSKSREEVHQP